MSHRLGVNILRMQLPDPSIENIVVVYRYTCIHVCMAVLHAVSLTSTAIAVFTSDHSVHSLTSRDCFKLDSIHV